MVFYFLFCHQKRKTRWIKQPLLFQRRSTAQKSGAVRSPPSPKNISKRKRRRHRDSEMRISSTMIIVQIFVALKLRLYSVMVPEERLELSLPKEHDFESCASTSSATRAKLKYFKISYLNFQIFVLRSVSSFHSGHFAPNALLASQHSGPGAYYFNLILISIKLFQYG